ncbi:MAG TPA: NosD domain-containing protein, partial [Gaiellaceae bacterium]|nr:NosD domain-containing protein [Gaiellaceae bacterium]
MAGAVGVVAMVLVPQALAGTFTVTTNADSGGGSLRQAILDANAAAGSDTITFAVGTGLQRITLASPLPAITQPVVLDAATQPSVTAPGIVLDGSSCATCADGLVVTGGGSTIKGLAVVGFDGRGVVFDGTQTGAGGNTLETSAVGWDPETSFFKNNGAAGVAILSSPNNTIGGSAAAKVVVAGDGNSAAGDDQTEILITGTASSGNVVSGNWIGLGADGTSSPDTANGVVVTAGAHDNTIGGAASAGNTFFVFYQDAIDIRSAGSGNVVAGNSIGVDDEGTVGSSDRGIGVEDSPGTTIGDSAVPPGFADTTRGNVVAGATGGVGILVSGSSDGTRIVGNFIGTDRQGASGLGNGQGVRVLDASGITIGPGNTVTANSSDGIEIAGGSGNRIVANSIFGNGANVVGAKGIRIDPGANGDIAAPVLTDAASASGTTTGHGTFQGTSPNEQVFVELFAGSSCDPRGGGERYLGSVTATGNANGFA